jgi:hypothetical protein
MYRLTAPALVDLTEVFNSQSDLGGAQATSKTNVVQMITMTFCIALPPLLLSLVVDYGSTTKAFDFGSASCLTSEEAAGPMHYFSRAGRSGPCNCILPHFASFVNRLTYQFDTSLAEIN